MTSITIPKSVLPGFQVIANLTEEEFSLILSFLQDNQYGFPLGRFHHFLDKEGIQSAKDIVNTLMSFERISYRSSTKAEIADDLIQSYIQQSGDDLNGQVNQLNSRLTIILENYHSLQISLKALKLYTEDSNIYRDSKIISDIRLIFNENLEEKTRSGLLIHKLHLEYSDNPTVAESKSFFISLEIEDLKELRDVIDRAIRKEEIIRADYKDSFNLIDIS